MLLIKSSIWLQNILQTVNQLDIDGETLRKENKDEKEKNEKLLNKYKVLEDEFDLLRIEHKKIVEHCKFLDQIKEIEDKCESSDCSETINIWHWIKLW